MNILITMQEGSNRDVFFPEKVIDLFRKLGNVRINDTEKPMTEEGLIKSIGDIDVCVTHWGSPQFTDEVLENAPHLKMIAHCAGSIAQLVTENVYAKGIKVCSSNSVMARYVAEGVLAYMLASLRLIPQHSGDMKNGVLWKRRKTEVKSLLEEKIGLIGLGTVGRYLLELLKPFNIAIKLYDPYIKKESLSDYTNLTFGTLDEVLEWGIVVSVHASLTPDTYHMLDADKLKLIKDGSVLINTARGAVFNEKDLENELGGGRIQAVLDVYEKEPLPLDSPFRKMDNVILMPHMAGAAAREKMTLAMLDEIERYKNNSPLKYEIPLENYRLMTRSDFIKK
jgi:phosphoglycerate dehydrogenase-like enzyme